MARRHRLIKKALESLGWSWEDDSYELNTIKDIDNIIWEAKDSLSQIENIRADLDESDELMKKSIEEMETLKNQIEIEEYKELNPKADVFKL